LARFVQELSARVDGLATGVASSGSVVSREDHVAIQEIRNNWYAMLPMLLNTASTIATISGHIQTLTARVQLLEELRLVEEARLAAQSSPALAQSDTSQSV
jgi:outer membrane murein-binding lipoprotein Lpp